MVIPDRILTSEYSEGIRHQLLHRFKTEFEVVDLAKGYISVPWVNRTIDAEYEKYAAELAAHHFAESGITVVAGIPKSGTSFGKAVARELRLPHLVGWKGDLPQQLENPIVTNSALSFTQENFSQFAFPRVSPGEHLLLVDDVCAHGHTGVAIARAFLERDVKVSFVVYFAKLFQGGLQEVQNLGVEAHYVIGVTRIAKDGVIEVV